MSLVGKSIYTNRVKKKVHCPFSFSDSKVKKKEPTLAQMAEEIFGEDKTLMMHLKIFLHNCAQKRQYPTRLSWSMQLGLLEKFPASVRVKQVTTSIMNGYRAIAYEGNLKKYEDDISEVSLEKEKEENICYDIAY